jgi:hypothetical protein
MSSDPGVKSLQFETAISTAPKEAEPSQQGVTCVVCRRPVRDEYFDVDGQSTCRSCQDEIARHAETPREWGVFARAFGFGVVAAILGAIVYYAVIAITEFEIGLVAIAIGYMVGYGIRMGTKGRGGRRFQVAALVLTYWAVGLAYMPFVFGAMSEQDAAQQASLNVTPPADPAEEPGEPLRVPVAVAALAGLSFALPVMAVVGSLPGGLISAAIIAFGMQQAWKMTGAPQPAISGPYRVGAGPPAPA